MESFRIRQPTTFESCKLAIICGRLGETIEIDEQDSNELKEFIHSISAPESHTKTCKRILTHSISAPGTLPRHVREFSHSTSALSVICSFVCHMGSCGSQKEKKLHEDFSNNQAICNLCYIACTSPSYRGE